MEVKSKTPGVYDPWVQCILAKLVERQVLCCASYLVSHLAKHPGEYEDELMNLTQGRPDYEQTLIEHVNGLNPYEFTELCIRYDLVPDTMSGRASQWLADSVDCEQVCQDLGLDTQYAEIYEHWVVSSWMADKLKEQGEVVEEVFNLYIWGRCCTGQAISLDYTFYRIAREMEILPGQKYEWSSR